MLLRHRWNIVTTYNNHFLWFFNKLSKELGLQAKKKKPKHKTTKKTPAPKMIDDNFDVLNEAIQMYLHIV